MKRRLFLIMPLIGLIVGCGGGSQPSREINLNEDVIVSLGETVLLRGEGATVAIESRLEDTRCPVDAQCAQAGSVVVRARVNSSEGSFTQDIKYPLLPTEVPAPPTSDYNVILKVVTPDRRVDTTIALSDYRFTIRVSKVN